MARRLGKRKQQRREDYMLKEQNKVDSGVFDIKTMVWLGKFFNKGIISTLGHIIARGKEADVYISEPGASPKVEGSKAVVLKFFRIETSSFYKMSEYIFGDPRFSKVSGRKYGIVMEWCKKEFGNLQIAERAGANAPTPYMFNGSILAMSLIGEDGVPAPRLKDCELSDPERTLDEILAQARKLYSSKLVHADLSEYNILMSKGVPYIIDFGQAVLLQHPKAPEFLKRDISNMLQYFSRRYGIERDLNATIKRVVS